eukprot:3313977-Rhodomonas_salina.1
MEIKYPGTRVPGYPGAGGFGLSISPGMPCEKLAFAVPLVVTPLCSASPYPGKSTTHCCQNHKL